MAHPSITGLPDNDRDRETWLGNGGDTGPRPAQTFEQALENFWRVVGKPRPQPKQEDEATGLAERRWSQR